jgi:hypothetical protein
MSLVIDLAPEVEASLRQEASRHGLATPDYVRRLIEEALPAAPKPGAATLALLAAWDAEDATDDPEEIAERNREFEEFKAHINADHTSDRVIYP